MIFQHKGIIPYKSVHPDFSKPIWQASLPSEAIVPLLQHQGAEAVPMVGIGDEVREGMLIGKAAASDGAGVHSPIPGTVQAITEIQLPDGQTSQAVVIKLRGQFDYLGKEKSETNWQSLSPLALIDLISEKGLVHLDSFTEPLAYMLGQLRKYGANGIVVNAASGSPFISSEVRLANENYREILTGIKVLQRILSTEQLWFVYPRRHHKLIRPLLNEARSEGLKLKVKALPDNYTAGDPYELIHMATGREMLPQSSYAKAGAGVFAVSTIFALYEAVVLRRALVDRLVTIGGGAMAGTRTVRVRIGTTVGKVFEEMGWLEKPASKILIGNPLQGYEIANANTPISKQVSAIIALTSQEIGASREVPCIHCGKCVDYCPANLEPNILHQLLQQDKIQDALNLSLMACRICGICSHVCPSHIPLTRILRDGIVMAESGEAGAGNQDFPSIDAHSGQFVSSSIGGQDNGGSDA